MTTLLQFLRDLLLRKTDVDFEIGVVMVRRSYDRLTTKGRRSDAIPIAGELRPHLEHALRASPSDLVFPREDGGGTATLG